MAKFSENGDFKTTIRLNRQFKMTGKTGYQSEVIISTESEGSDRILTARISTRSECIEKLGLVWPMRRAEPSRAEPSYLEIFKTVLELY